MALYTEQSADILASMLQAGEEERRRKQQAKALQEYNARKQQADNKYDGGLGGFLGNIVGGIGKSIGDVGYALGGMFGTAGASVGDLVGGIGKGITTGDWNISDENARAFKRTYYGAKDDKDAAAKAAGNALNAATTVATTVAPGLAGAGAAAGKAAGVASKALGGTIANTAAGALGGVADEFAQQGSDARLDSAVNRALSGAAAGLATGGLNRKIGNATGNVSSKLLNNKLATSTIGRGALSGAVGGATGAGTSAALGGGDVAQAALQGGLTGAVAGGTQAGLMDAGRNIGINARNKVSKAVTGKDWQTGTNPAITTTRTTGTEEEPFAAYGESELAKKTKGNRAADNIRRFGEELEGAQTNITRTAARKLGIESPGKVVDNVRKRTGLSDIELQADLARELTGGDNSLLDNIQRYALSANEDGSGRFVVDTGNLLSEAEQLVRQKMSGLGEKAVNSEIDNVRYALSSKDSSLLDKANQYESLAAELRGKGTVNATPGDKAKAAVYKELATKLEDMSYSAIPKENVDAMFGAAVSEMRARATQARNNGNKDIETAYTMLANEMENTPHTIRNFRNFKKDFVDTSKVNTLTEQAQNGAAQNMGQSAGGIKKKVGNLMFGRLVNKGAAKTGEFINDNIAPAIDSLGGNQTATGTTPRVQTQPMSQDAQALLGNVIGRTQGQAISGEKVQNARKAEEYQNLEDMFANITATPTAEPMYPVQRQTSQIEAQLADISNGMGLALAAGDFSAYNQLANLYKNTYSIYEMQNEMAGQSAGGTSNMSTAEKNQIAKLQSAGTALDQLESLYKKAGGGQGIIGGNIANFLGGLGLNSDVNTYNQLAQGLINQIGAAIGKTDSLNTEGEVQRALSLVPKITDDNQTAMNKIATLRSLLQTNTGTYNQLYGA